MDSFVAIDSATANPRRVNACTVGYAIARNGKIIATGRYLIRPAGSHAFCQAQIHGTTAANTHDQPACGAWVARFSPLPKKPPRRRFHGGTGTLRPAGLDKKPPGISSVAVHPAPNHPGDTVAG